MRPAVRLTAMAAVGAIVAGAIIAWSSMAVARLPASSAASAGLTPRPAVSLAGRPASSPGAGWSGSSPSAPPGLAPQARVYLAVAGPPRRVRAKGAVLADAATGAMLWSRGLNTERPMASVTKVMTALVVIRAGDLGRKIRISHAVRSYIRKYGADSAGLRPGNVLTTRQLLYAMLLPSGSDAAYTLATSYGPGMKAFLARMNATARQLGMLHTHFTSPDGLPYPTEHSTYSTPADLLRLGLAAMKLSAFRTIVAARSYLLPKGAGHRHYYWQNTNDLLGSFRGAVGIKTGYTDAARHCLLFEAVRHGLTLIGVVLGSPATGPASGAKDAARILNWGFGLQRR